MPNFDASRYSPPAPVAEVMLRAIGASILLKDVKMLIDTGADMTLIPRGAVEKLGVTPHAGKDYQLLGFDGARSVAQSVELDMVFLNKAYRGRCLLMDDDHGILGRDVLCNVVVTFDGPSRQWFESSPNA